MEEEDRVGGWKMGWGEGWAEDGWGRGSEWGRVK